MGVHDAASVGLRLCFLVFAGAQRRRAQRSTGGGSFGAQGQEPAGGGATGRVIGRRSDRQLGKMADVPNSKAAAGFRPGGFRTYVHHSKFINSTILSPHAPILPLLLLLPVAIYTPGPRSFPATSLLALAL